MKKYLVLTILMFLVAACSSPTPETIIETVIIEVVVTATPEPISFDLIFQGFAKGHNKVIPDEMPYGVWEVTGENCDQILITGMSPKGWDYATKGKSIFTLTGYKGIVLIFSEAYNIIYPITCTFTFLGVDYGD